MGLRVGDEDDGKKWWPECIGRRWGCDMSVETSSMVERVGERLAQWERRCGGGRSEMQFRRGREERDSESKLRYGYGRRVYVNES